MDLNGTQMAYLLIVIFLFVLAVIDLWVGVSNDAVNFIGSAVGARAAKLKHVMIVAAAGVFVGAAFSNGMMEVARSGIFSPSEFVFSEVMVIFLAVMVSDVFLLDLFNSLGLPTSTTVSMVFELLGAAFIVALIKIASGSSDIDMFTLLNTDKALVMIISIFLSVAVAFLLCWCSGLRVLSSHFIIKGTLEQRLESLAEFQLPQSSTSCSSKDSKAQRWSPIQ